MFLSRYSYHSLPNDEENKTNGRSESMNLRVAYLCRNVALLIIAATFLVWTVHFLERNSDRQPDISISQERIWSSDNLWLRYGWWSKYSTNDHLNSTAAREVDRAWDDIMPSHGVVAVKHQWAADQGLPSSMDLPSDDSKGVYILDAYHQIHCLTIIRKTWYQLERGQAMTWPAGHTVHCFDALRQYIMCTAGDTLLYTMGRNKTGDGQYRQCKDWSVLREWATEHTACYRDNEKSIPLEEHFGYCDKGFDGIEWSRED